MSFLENLPLRQRFNALERSSIRNDSRFDGTVKSPSMGTMMTFYKVIKISKTQSAGDGEVVP